MPFPACSGRCLALAYWDGEQAGSDSQRVDIHPYEEGQGFQRLLDMPGYDVAALVLKSGKSTSHVYARLSLLQLIPDVAQAFVEERITASHANLIARLPQEHQADAFEQCWRKDWSDKEPHLLPAKHLAAWIEANLYLALADAPFDREDITLNPDAGACAACPRRSGYNTSLFAEVQGDQCLDGACYQTKVSAHIDRELVAQPHLVQIETSWRPVKEQRPGILPKHSYRELDIPDNPDSEPCPNTKSALIVFGRNAGKTITVCTDSHCPLHDPTTAARLAREEAENPVPVMEPAPEEETEEEAEQRQAEYEQRRREHEAEQQRREEERKAEQEREQQEHEAEQQRREELNKARAATFERILDLAPATFTAAQLRTFLRLIVHIDPYSFLEEVASHFAGNDENAQQTDEEIVLAALDSTADHKLTGFALRLVLAGHFGIPHSDQPDLLAEAEGVFAPPQPKSSKPKSVSKSKEAPTEVKTTKKTATKTKAA